MCFVSFRFVLFCFIGCGVRNTGFLTKVNVDITQSGNSYSTVLADIDQSKPLIFNVLVERQGGYYAAYTETTFNGNACHIVIVVSFLVAVVVIAVVAVVVVVLVVVSVIVNTYILITVNECAGSSLMSVSPVALVVALLLAFFANC